METTVALRAPSVSNHLEIPLEGIGFPFANQGVGQFSVATVGQISVAIHKDGQKYGEYRTKRVILECYDAMAEAMKTGRTYQTTLDPPPADPRVAHSSKEA